jgi:predicted metal-dependent peptidase
MGERDPERWNEAADFAINPIVVGAGFKLPAKVLLDPRYAGMSAEAIYAELRQKQSGKGGGKPQTDPQSAGQSPPQPGGGQSAPPTANDPSAAGAQPAQAPQSAGSSSAQSGGGGAPAPSSRSCGEVRPYRGDDLPQREAQWKVAVLQAARAAKMAGKLPGDLQAVVSAAVAPAVDWRAHLHRFACERTDSDFSWAQPNRRYTHLNLYLPSLNELTIGDAVFVRDSSGSVFDATQNQFAAEIGNVRVNLNPRRLIVLDCDTKVRQVQIFEQADEFELKPVRGGGGTAFSHPFEWLEEEEIRPAFVVYLTDLDGRFPSTEPDYPVLWASTTQLKRLRHMPAFGECVEVIV